MYNSFQIYKQFALNLHKDPHCPVDQRLLLNKNTKTCFLSMKTTIQWICFLLFWHCVSIVELLDGRNRMYRRQGHILRKEKIADFWGANYPEWTNEQQRSNWLTSLVGWHAVLVKLNQSCMYVRIVLCVVVVIVTKSKACGMTLSQTAAQLKKTFNKK